MECYVAKKCSVYLFVYSAVPLGIIMVDQRLIGVIEYLLSDLLRLELKYLRYECNRLCWIDRQ